MEEDLFSRMASSPQDDPERVTLDNELAALVWEAAQALNPNDYTLLDLNIRKGLGPEELAAALGTTRGNVYTRLSRLRDSLEEAVTTLILARRARGDCSELNELLQGSDPAAGLTPRARRAISRHIQACPACETNRRRYLSATALFGGLAAVAPTLALKSEIWGGLAAAAAGAPPPPPPPASPAGQAAQSAQSASSGSVGGAAEIVKTGAQLWASLGVGVQAMVATLVVAGAIGVGVAATVLFTQPSPEPLPTVLQLRLVDPDIGASGIARNRQLQIEVEVASGSQGVPPDLQWLMQEAPAPMPSPQDPGWAPWPPDAFTLSEGDGVKMVDLWLQSPQGEVTHGEQTQVLLDTTAPQDPAGALSPSHQIGVPSTNNLVTVQCEPAVDREPGSGIAGYSILWDQSPLTVPPGDLDLDASATEATSPPLGGGSWYFHLSTLDLAGNRTNTLHLGPFIIESNIPAGPGPGGNGGAAGSNGDPGAAADAGTSQPDSPQPLEDLPSQVTPPDAPELEVPDAPVDVEPQDPEAEDEPQPAPAGVDDSGDGESPAITQFGDGSNGGDQSDGGDNDADPPADPDSGNQEQPANGNDEGDPPGDADNGGDQPDGGDNGADPPDGESGDAGPDPAATPDITLSPLEDSLVVGSTYALTATVTLGTQPVSGAQVNFLITTGPHQDRAGSSLTDADGLAQFSYVGETPGTDTIQACIDNPNGEEPFCASAFADWTQPEEPDAGGKSCLGKNSCQGRDITVGENSCNGDNSCNGNNIVIGDNSCNEEGSCLGNGNTVGDRSCNGRSACQSNQLKIGDDSCNGDGACGGNGNGNNSTIGHRSCNGTGACTGNNINVDDDACNYEGACSGQNNKNGNGNEA
jgi:hypothetical protein